MLRSFHKPVRQHSEWEREKDRRVFGKYRVVSLMVKWTTAFCQCFCWSGETLAQFQQSCHNRVLSTVIPTVICFVYRSDVVKDSTVQYSSSANTERIKSYQLDWLLRKKHFFKTETNPFCHAKSVCFKADKSCKVYQCIINVFACGGVVVYGCCWFLYCGESTKTRVRLPFWVPNIPPQKQQTTDVTLLDQPLYWLTIGAVSS